MKPNVFWQHSTVLTFFYMKWNTCWQHHTVLIWSEMYTDITPLFRYEVECLLTTPYCFDCFDMKLNVYWQHPTTLTWNGMSADNTPPLWHEMECLVTTLHCFDIKLNICWQHPTFLTWSWIADSLPLIKTNIMTYLDVSVEVPLEGRGIITVWALVRFTSRVYCTHMRAHASLHDNLRK